jgi:hypothetical protein
MSFDELLEAVVEEFRADPRNKVFAPEPLLLASVQEETGKSVSPEKLRDVIADYVSGSIDDADSEIYDGAVYSCSQLAKACFSEDPEDELEEVEYEVSWIENEDGSYSAEVRPA